MTQDNANMSHPSELLFSGADAAWRVAVKQVEGNGKWVEPIQDTLSIGSSFGRKARTTKEILAYQFAFQNCRQRIIQSAARPVNYCRAVAQLIWMLAGSNDVGFISFYNRLGSTFSDDGLTLHAAPGARVFDFPGMGDQFEEVIRRIKSDPSTRRAVIQFYSPSDIVGAHRDVSCFLSMQFMVRGNRLVALSLMRSQSAVMVMPYDLFLLTALHEAVAVRLGLEPGTFNHWCGSLHFYDDEESLAKSVTSEVPSAAMVMSPMPPLTEGVRMSLAAAEQDIRTRLNGNFRDAPADIDKYDLDPYWKGLLGILVVGARREHDCQPLPGDIDAVPRELRPLIIV